LGPSGTTHRNASVGKGNTGQGAWKGTKGEKIPKVGGDLVGKSTSERKRGGLTQRQGRAGRDPSLTDRNETSTEEGCGKEVTDRKKKTHLPSIPGGGTAASMEGERVSGISLLLGNI